MPRWDTCQRAMPCSTNERPTHGPTSDAVKRKANAKHWRRESPRDIALDILREYFNLNTAAMSYLMQHHQHTPETLVALKVVGIKLNHCPDASALDSLRMAKYIETNCAVLTPRGVNAAAKLAELAVLLNAMMDNYYLSSQVVQELRRLRSKLSPGSDIHRVVWASRERRSSEGRSGLTGCNHPR